MWQVFIILKCEWIKTCIFRQKLKRLEASVTSLKQGARRVMSPGTINVWNYLCKNIKLIATLAFRLSLIVYSIFCFHFSGGLELSVVNEIDSTGSILDASDLSFDATCDPTLDESRTRSGRHYKRKSSLGVNKSRYWNPHHSLHLFHFHIGSGFWVRHSKNYPDLLYAFFKGYLF